MAEKPNRFLKNHPPVEPADFNPEALLYAGREETPTNAAEENSKPKEKASATKSQSKTVVDNPLAGKITKKPTSKSYAIYLDEEVVEAVDKLAKQNKLSRSKALNELLRTILLSE